MFLTEETLPIYSGVINSGGVFHTAMGQDMWK